MTYQEIRMSYQNYEERREKIKLLYNELSTKVQLLEVMKNENISELNPAADDGASVLSFLLLVISHMPPVPIIIKPVIRRIVPTYVYVGICNVEFLIY
jgi:hypothetical protein